jgi:hypothetical protein
VLSADDRAKWEEIAKKIFQDSSEYNQQSLRSSKHLSRKHKSADAQAIDREFTTTVGVELDENNKDQSKFEDVHRLRKPCHQIKWNVADEHSNVLILTVKMESNEAICSLSNMNSKAAYRHMCQYGEYTFRLSIN